MAQRISLLTTNRVLVEFNDPLSVRRANIGGHDIFGGRIEELDVVSRLSQAHFRLT